MSRNAELTIYLIASSLIAFALVTFVIYIIIVSKKRQDSLSQDLQILELNSEKNILRAQLEIQEETFKKISQEIHDNISLSMTLAKLNLNTIELIFDDSVKQKIEASIDLISKSLSDLNDISKSLDAEFIENQGLIKAIQYECEIVQRSGKYFVDLEITGNPVFLESEKELLIFRMVQESFNNIIKHAEADRIKISLSYCDDQLSIYISDNGKGFEHTRMIEKVNSLRSAGLRNFMNRASILKASVQFQNNQPTGTTLSIQIPLQDDAPEKHDKN
jgi:two-component system, NarL family, sensor kinase